MDIIPNDGDVISVNEPAASPTNTRTFTYSELIAAVKQHSPLLYHLASSTIDCQYLSEQGGGWKKGKIQLKFQITLEEDSPT